MKSSDVPGTDAYLTISKSPEMLPDLLRFFIEHSCKQKIVIQHTFDGMVSPMCLQGLGLQRSLVFAILCQVLDSPFRGIFLFKTYQVFE